MSSQSATPPRNTPEAKAFRKRMKAFKKTIGANIERIRKAQDVPLRTLARKTGFSAVTLDYWEMGRMNIPLDAILRIPKLLKVPHERLFAVPAGENAALEQQAIAPETVTKPQENDAPEKVLDRVDDILLMHLLEDPEVQLIRDMLARKRQESGYPDEHTVQVMEEPLRGVFELSLLFSDLVTGMPGGVPFQRHGLAWLASSLRQDTERLYRPYQGRPRPGMAKRDIYEPGAHYSVPR